MRELDLAVDAAREAGAIIRELYGTDVSVVQKGDREESPLTEADTRADRVIRDILRTAFPDDGWLSEESADSPERLEKKRAWIIDPLDGTREFVMKIPELAVAIGLVDEGRPVVGVVYNPIRDELFTAAPGCPVELNGEEVRVTPRMEPEGAVLLASRSEDSRGEWDPFKDRFCVELTGSVAYKLALIAAGRADGTFTLTPKSEWDVCASVCLLEAAGGRATDLDGKPLRFNNRVPKLSGMIASNGVLHEALLAATRSAAS